MHTSFYFAVNIRFIISYSELQMVSGSIKQRCLVSLHTHQSEKLERECRRQVCSALQAPNAFHFMSAVLLHLEKCSKFQVFSISNLFWFYADLGERALSGVFLFCDLWIFFVNMARSFGFFSFVIVCIGYKGNCRKGSALVFWE